MSLLENWVGTPLAGALGWTVLHSLWEGAILAAALAVVLMATRSPRIRYAAACVAMLAMLAGFGVTFIHELPQGADGLRTIGPTTSRVWNVEKQKSASAGFDFGLAAAVPWLAPVWIAGVLIFYLRHIAGWISVSRLRRRGVCCAPDEWQQQLLRLSAQLRLTRPVRLFESCLVDAPMVLGHFRPFILMPIGLLAGLPAGQIEAILLHELAHIRRFDYLVNVVERFVEGLLFYHPAVWWMARVIRNERESCCDDAVVAMSGKAHEYAVALAALEEKRWSGQELAMAATGGSLVKRIRRLLYPKGPNSIWTPLCAVAVFVVTAVVAVNTLYAAPPQQNSTAQTSPYMKWLNGDVVYIITAAERAEFLKLTDDEEREHFVEQFWERRNPTPGSAENEFKKEHYRRIAWANEHYGATVPGWKTDRGRLYIMWGPPDEIDSHLPGDEASAFPYEMWRYRYIEGIGENVEFGFTDLSRNGEYPLTLDPRKGIGPYEKPIIARVRVAPNIQAQNLISQAAPIYPPEAMQARVQGVVRFRIEIGKGGRVSNVQLMNGHPLLVPAASDAVRQWVYKPTLLNGYPMVVVTEVDVNFLLAGK